jgi:predicted MFS family arabinose efflux permease
MLPSPVNDPDTLGPDRTMPYAWLVFALTFGLLIADFMARQVLNAVFPLLKAEWVLSDAQLGWLSGVVALMVGILAFPLSLLADRWGRAKSLTLMAVLWSLATLLCGIAQNYEQMLVGRLLVGVGEAAYGSVGIAVVLSVFPARMRATLTGAFMAGGIFGQMLGVGLGGQIAASHGWRAAFVMIALAGLALAFLYPILVRDKKNASLAGVPAPNPNFDRVPLKTVVGNASLRYVYIASGLQLFTAGGLLAWLPSYLNRYYSLPFEKAATLAALYLLIAGAGVIFCGILSDRMAKDRAVATMSLSIVLCLICAILLTVALALPPGAPQVILLVGAYFLALGTAGPSGAMVANLTPPVMHGTAFASLALVNNLIGLAPGPILVGRLADSFGLLDALRFLPIACLLAAITFLMARRSYENDLKAIMARR